MLYTNKVDSFSVTANLISPACIVSLKDYLCQHFLQHFLPVNVTNMYDPWFLQQWTIPPVVLCLVLQELPGHRGFRWLVFFSTSGCWILGFWSLALAVAMLSCLPPVPPPPHCPPSCLQQVPFRTFLCSQPDSSRGMSIFISMSDPNSTLQPSLVFALI